MKVGDKILCKKDYPNSGAFNRKQLYSKDSYYTIKEIGMVQDHPLRCNFITFEKNDKCFSLVYQRGINYFYEHFYDIQEMRRMKLNNINKEKI